jgi:xanthine phosphoribosyltransferase
MRLLEEKILKYGKVYPGNILKVDSFLNHQVDMALMGQLAQEIYNNFKDCAVTKVLTIEASGIPLAGATAQFFNVPMIFAKKASAKNMSANFYSAKVYSFTHGSYYEIKVCKDYLTKDDTVLIVDDFLANGSALESLMDIVNQAGAKVAGAGIAIEKGFQKGGDELRAKGIKIVSLAIIDEMSAEKGITFRSPEAC